MDKAELKLINAVCQSKNIEAVLSKNMDVMFTSYPDVWQFVKDHYLKYHSVPDAAVVQERFDDFDILPAPGETAYLVNELKEDFTNSKLGEITLKLRDRVGKSAPEKVLKGVIADLMKLQNIAVESKDIDITDFEQAAEEYQRVRERSERMGGSPGIMTGISFLDASYQSGFAGGDLIVVLGWTGRNKSTIAAKICVNAFNQGFKPMIVSLEMGTNKVRDRVYTMMSNGALRNTDLSAGMVSEDDFRHWAKKQDKHNGFVVVSHDGNDEITPAVIQSKIDQHKPDIVVLDYAQLMSDNANSADMTARMRNMSKELKRLATANDIPVVLISSATPDSSTSVSTPPIIEQVAWSKQLAFDADLAFAVHKHDGVLDDGSVIIELVGRKNRNGELFSGYLKANINTGVYEEVFSLEDTL